MNPLISLDHSQVDTGIKNARICIAADGWPMRKAQSACQRVEICIGRRELLDNGFEGRQIAIEPPKELFNARIHAKSLQRFTR